MEMSAEVHKAASVKGVMFSDTADRILDLVIRRKKLSTPLTNRIPLVSLVTELFSLIARLLCDITNLCKVVEVKRTEDCLSLLQTTLRAAAHQLRQDKHQDMRQKKQKLTSTSWLRPVCGGFHNLIRFNCAPFFVSCRKHRVLTVTCLDACRCAAYLTQKPAANRRLKCLALISAVREYGLVPSTHTRKSASAHVISHYNRAVPYASLCYSRTASCFHSTLSAAVLQWMNPCSRGIGLWVCFTAAFAPGNNTT
jgi:hypothetical protein